MFRSIFVILIFGFTGTYGQFTADWSKCTQYADLEKDGFRFSNNRWGGGDMGCINVKYGPPNLIWWTTHNDVTGITMPCATTGNDWGYYTKGTYLPCKIRDLEILKASWEFTVSTSSTDSYQIYWQTYLATTGNATKPNRGDFSPAIYISPACDQNWWGKYVGTYTIGDRKWRIIDCGQNGFGSGKYYKQMLDLKPDANKQVRVDTADLKSLYDWHCARGDYSLDDYLLEVQFAYEIFRCKGNLYTTDMAITMKVTGKPQITLPSWSTMISGTASSAGVPVPNNRGSRIYYVNPFSKNSTLYDLNGKVSHSVNSHGTGLKIIKNATSERISKSLPVIP